MVGPVAEGVLVLFFFLREFLGEKRNENFDQEIPLYRIRFALKEVAMYSLTPVILKSVLE